MTFTLGFLLGYALTTWATAWLLRRLRQRRARYQCGYIDPRTHVGCTRDVLHRGRCSWDTAPARNVHPNKP